MRCAVAAVSASQLPPLSAPFGCRPSRWLSQSIRIISLLSLPPLPLPLSSAHHPHPTAFASS